MHSLENLLHRYVSKKTVPVEMREYRFFRDWAVIVGQGISNKSRPLGFRGNRLIIVVTSSAWAQTLKMSADDLLYKINKNLQFTQVKGLDFQVVTQLPSVGEPKQVHALKNALEGVPGNKNSADPILSWEMAEIDAISAEMKDADTRLVIQSLGIKIYAHSKS